MSTSKKQCAFYADEDVEKWYKSAPHGGRSKTLNNLVRAHLGLPIVDGLGQPQDIDDRLTKLEEKVDRLIHRLGFAVHEL